MNRLRLPLRNRRGSVPDAPDGPDAPDAPDGPDAPDVSDAPHAPAGHAGRGRYAVEHQAAGRCLGYPDERLRADLPLVRRALDGRPGASARLVRGFLDHAETTSRQELEQHYVRTFDLKNRRCLHLSWWTDGDTRRRGRTLVGFKQTYRAHGLEYTDREELPDFLPAVLEFTARTGDDGLLRRNRPGLELLRLSLTECGTPYAQLLEAVCATLPGPSPRDRTAARALARSGPPREDVGLEPYGQPPPTGPQPRGPGTTGRNGAPR